MTLHAQQTNHKTSGSGTSTAEQARSKFYSARMDSNLHGFIHHPPGLPILCKALKKDTPAGEPGDIGLCFEWGHYIKPGTLLEVDIPLRGEVQKFRGKVILVRTRDTGFEIGIWLQDKSDSARIRIVEQICHIEVYLKHKRHHEGPFVSPERVAQEWISRFASRFPSPG